jgi:AcrR family transcriptional regulator
MLKATAQEVPPGIKSQIVEAALESLKRDGFAGASARAIARRGGFNQALVFYHFGSVQTLLLAALDETSRRRMERYEAALDSVSTPAALFELAREIYLEDLESGHITVLSEMIAGSLTHPDLGPEITARIQPWIDFAERAVNRAVEGTPLEDLLPARDIAFAIVAFYVGADLLTVLDGDRARVERLFQLGQTMVVGMGWFIGRTAVTEPRSADA